MVTRDLPILLLFLALAPGHAASAGTENAPATTYNQIRPLLEAKCRRCHNERSLKADLNLTSLTGILRGGESGPAVFPGNAEKSLLFEKVASGAMPPGKKDPLSPAEVALLRRWIADGAKAGPLPTGEQASAANSQLSQHDVQPIFLRHCTTCHGLRRQEAGLDLRTKAAMARGGKSGPAIVLGKPEESPIVKILRAGKMPPPDRLQEASVKVIEASAIDTIARWIAAGAPEVDVKPDVATAAPDPLVSETDREFWAFQPPKTVAIPTVGDARRIRNPIDSFLLQKLEAKGLTFAPEADRATLLRRASFDLTGLPPEPAEVEAFLADSSPTAYESAIDRLLASPRYGERWGRYWLDLAGYADSEGKREQDLPRPHAWRYRDYVIRSFNSDKPYSRFLLEQIAGDELADYEQAPEITSELYDNLVATGFLRMAPDGTWANITGFVQDRLEVVSDEIDVLGSAVMGLTLKCARCHSHKFDPLPHRDYYRLVDIFKGAYDEYDWLRPDVRPGLGPMSQDFQGGRHLPYVTTAERKAWEQHNAALRKESAALKQELEQRTQTVAAKVREERLQQLPEVLRDDVRKMLAVPPKDRDVVQKYLAEKFEKELRPDANALKALDAVFKKDAEAAEARIKALASRELPEPRVQALWDRGTPSPTYIYRRGDPLLPSRLVGPGVPSVLTDGKTPFEVKPPWPGAQKTGRRLAFARWLIQPNHPLTARVMVNRLWKHHFGAGLVPTLANFGKAGALPTHPELLDWLALEFIRRGWSLKEMHRLMMTSTAYRQSSTVAPTLAASDPANALHGRMPLNRLDAEALYDALLLVSGRLNEARFGPADPVQTRPDGLVTPMGTPAGWRRLIYVQQKRKQIPTHLENFDYPQMNPNCVERRDSTVAPQALHLMNNGMVQQLAEHFAQRVSREAGGDPALQVERVALLALSRLPTTEEKAIGREALDKLTAEWAKTEASAEAARAKALTTYCHAIMNSAAFLYVD